MITTMVEEKKTYTIKEACAYLGWSDSTIRRLIKRGLMKRSKSVRKISIPAEDVEKFIERTH